MVVISASLITKQGKILLARQFLEITRSSLEGLLSAFIKQVDTIRQHTYINHENTRFVFQPINDNYLILITSKDSNIIEDLEILKLLYKIVQHFCPFGPDGTNVLKNSFELVLAFDDAISLGYRENITLSQILTNAEMESAEEAIFKEKQKAKMKEAKKYAKKRQNELNKKRVMEKKMNKEIHDVEEVQREILRPVVIKKEIVVENTTLVTESSVKLKGGMMLFSRGKRGMDF
ncbi:hypothetical protein SteCoe_23619 [Stentor coeruleus]|uniref:Coatomer subunit delta n=1 Tax=Stentor coeruleus TaxID=5963 RepID=A0A1R2BJX6_9CILI|nr:hypothetical protein SteCoe_23619 [Stentor coeruleus]